MQVLLRASTAGAAADRRHRARDARRARVRRHELGRVDAVHPGLQRALLRRLHSGDAQGAAARQQVAVRRSSTRRRARSTTSARAGYCGQAVTFRRSPLSAPAIGVVLAQLPRGIDTDFAMSSTTNPGTMHQDPYFGRQRCGRDEYDIYVLKGVDVPTGPTRGRSVGGAASGGRATLKRLSFRGASPRHA